jgi:hypothetical protein
LEQFAFVVSLVEQPQQPKQLLVVEQPQQPQQWLLVVGQPE